MKGHRSYPVNVVFSPGIGIGAAICTFVVYNSSSQLVQAEAIFTRLYPVSSLPLDWAEPGEPQGEEHHNMRAAVGSSYPGSPALKCGRSRTGDATHGLAHCPLMFVHA
jgi:hypothetical protein